MRGKAACKGTQQLPTLLCQQCWELLRACWQWCPNGCNNSQQCWDLQCIVGRIQPISLCKPCIMSVRGPNNVGRAVQTDPTLLRYASAITEQKKCWKLLAEKFDRFQTLRNNTQQHPTTCNRVCKRTQHETFTNVGSCWSTMLRLFARSLSVRLYATRKMSSQWHLPRRAWLACRIPLPAVPSCMSGGYQLSTGK